MTLTRRKHGTGHSYRLDDAPVTGVTSIIRAGLPAPALVWWAGRTVADFVANADEATLDSLRMVGTDAMIAALAKIPDQVRNEAAARGRAVHKLAERLSKGERIDFEEIPSELHAHVEVVLAFLDEWGAVPVLTEAVVGSRQPRYAGTLDLVADLPDGRRVLFDYKTAKRIYPKDAVQLAAYRFAEFYVGTDGTEVPMSEVGIDAAMAVHLRADGYDVIPVKTGDSRSTSPAFEVFRACAAIAYHEPAMKDWLDEIAPRPTGVAA